MARRFSFQAVLILWLVYDVAFASIQFDRRTTGVGFSAYVKKTENKVRPGWETYSLGDVKAMLEVISTRFTRVATFGVGAENVPYVQNKTYPTVNAQGLSAEAAAVLNKERASKSITMLIGIWMSDFEVQTDTEIRVAFESAKIANKIYAGTAEGLVFSNDKLGSNPSRTEEALNLMIKFGEQAHSSGLKVGSRQPCFDIGKKRNEIGEIQRKIVNISDFIICDLNPGHNLAAGAKAGFTTVKNDLMIFRTQIQKINPDIEVMGQTSWPSKGANVWENIDNLKNYWEVVNKWGSENNFTMWLIEAFDNEWKDWNPNEAHKGWWKLRRNADVGKVEGYAEKIFEPPEKDTPPQAAAEAPTSPWVYIGGALGVIVFLIFCGLVGMLFLRVNKLQATITNEDIREFMHGLSDEAAAAQGDQIESALKFPYDKSYEITKEKLKIRHDALLGTGQFGCVYKALIENEEKLEVALKMTKSDCPKTALKGLLSEIKILTYLGKHPNIVSIHGAYTAELGKGVVYLATELCGLGSLEGYLRKYQTNITDTRYANAPAPVLKVGDAETQFSEEDVSFLEMLRWSHEIACGMEYLGTKHVVHADLSTRNVLLAIDRTAKITDFGLSRRLYDYTNYVKQQQEPLPWRWMAIESLKRLEFSSKSDVWSYGVTLWEIFAMGDLPYPGLSWNLDFVDNLVNGLRMKCPPHANEEVYKVMVDCWHSEPKDRPTFTDLKLTTSHLMEASLKKPENSADPPTVYTNLEF